MTTDPPKMILDWERTRGYALGRQDAACILSPVTEVALRFSPSPVLEKASHFIQKMHTLDEAEKSLEIKRHLDSLSPDERRWALKSLLSDHNKLRSDLDVGRKEKMTRHALLTRAIAAIEELQEWSEKPLHLEKMTTSVFRQMRRDVAAGNVISATKKIEDGFPSDDYERELFRPAESFVIQHDWAQAFERASDIIGAPFQLPYDVCAFEFKISGRYVVAMATEANEGVVFTPFFETSHGWVVPEMTADCGGSRWNDGACSDVGKLADVVGMMAGQIRAIAIALDAEIAVSEAVRVPASTLHKNFHAPLKPYHVVSLAHRTRVVPLENPTTMGRKKRLHFRRGHWRHFSNFKTWIKWMLVGDPDLGFVDKEYRL